MALPAKIFEKVVGGAHAAVGVAEWDGVVELGSEEWSSLAQSLKEGRVAGWE